MIYTFGPFHLCTEPLLLLRDGAVVLATPRALACLLLLVERRSTAVGKQELMDALWPDSFVEEGSLTQLISLLRKTLAPGFPGGSPIQTIPKTGYRFSAAVAISPELGAAAAPPHTTSENLPEPQREQIELTDADAAHSFESGNQPGPAQARVPAAARPRKWLYLAVLSIVVIDVAVLLTIQLHRHRSTQSVGDRHAVAVLPFQNLSRAPESAWIGVAVQEMLATDLRLSRSLRVLSSEDVNRALQEVNWTGEADPSEATLRRLGPDLDCDHAVLGAYLLQGGHIRLDVRVVNLRTGGTEVESAYEQPEDSLLPMLAQVSNGTARGLHVPADSTGQAEAQTADLDPSAYKLFAEGVLRNRVYDFRGAIDLLQRSAILAPDFPLTHTQLSLAWSARGQEKEAIAEAERAQQLSGRLPREQQLVVQARLESARHDFAQAAATYRTLFSFVPDNSEYGRLLIQSLSNAGNSDAALQEANTMLKAPANRAADPLLFSVIADMYSDMGDWRASLQWARRGAEESRRRGATILYERLLTTESQANLHLGEYALANSQTEEALTLSRQFRDISGELRALNRLGEVATQQKNWPAAEKALLAAVALEHTYDQPQREAHTLLTLSRLNQTRGDLPRAYRYCQQAMKLAETLRFAHTVAEASLQTAMLQKAMGHPTEARHLLAKVQTEAVSMHDADLADQANRAAK